MDVCLVQASKEADNKTKFSVNVNSMRFWKWMVFCCLVAKYHQKWTWDDAYESSSVVEGKSDHIAACAQASGRNTIRRNLYFRIPQIGALFPLP